MAERWYGGWDSGINSEVPSAAATKPPSCSGHESVKPSGYQSVTYGAQQVYYTQNQQQVAVSSAPEVEISQPTPTQPVQQQPSTVNAESGFPQSFSQPVIQPKIDTPFTPPANKLFGTPRLQHCSEDHEDITVQAIPKLIQLLRDEDPVVVSHAGVLVLQFSKSERGKQTLISSQPMIQALVETLSTSNEPEVIRTVTGTLHSLSQLRQGLKVICQSGGVPGLVFVLQAANCPVDQVTLHYALTMLHNALLQDSEIGQVKQTFRAAQGAAVLTRLLSRDNPKFLAILADCLHHLCMGHSESKLAVVANGGPQHLVRVMRCYTYEKLLWAVSRLLKVLSTCQQNKSAIIEAGGMHALTAQLSQPSSRLVMNCLWSLRNLSDAATKQTGLDHLMHFLLTVISTIGDRDMVACAVGILSNLTCNNQHNKIVICNSSGVEVIFKMLISLREEYVEILEAGIFTLRHLTSRHPASEHAQATFRSIGGVQFIVQLLSAPWSSIRPPIVKATCGLLRNLALVEANHQMLLESGSLHRLANILVPAVHELMNAAEAGSTAPKSQDGTRLDDLSEQAAAAVHALLRDPTCRQVAKQTGIPQALIQMQKCPLVSEAARKQASGALTDFANDTVPSSQQIQSRSQSSQQHTGMPPTSREAPQPPPATTSAPPPQSQISSIAAQQQPSPMPTTPMLQPSNVPAPQQQPQQQQQQPNQQHRQQQQPHVHPTPIPQQYNHAVQPHQYPSQMMHHPQMGMPAHGAPPQPPPPQSQQLMPMNNTNEQTQQQQPPSHAHLPQSPYHNSPRVMSTQPSMAQQQQLPPSTSVAPLSSMVPQQQSQEVQMHHQQSQYSQLSMHHSGQAMGMSAQQASWYQATVEQEFMQVPPLAHQHPYANQYTASPQHFGYST